MIRGARTACILAVLASAAGCETNLPHVPEPLEPDSGARVGAAVIESVRLGEHPRVVVALEPERSGPSAAAVGGVEAMIEAVGATADGLLSRVSDQEFHVLHRFRAVPALVLELRSEGALERLAADPAVRRIDLDVGGTGGLAVSVAQVRADLRHGQGHDGEGVVVAVLDSGIDATHPELAGALRAEFCFGFRAGGGFCHNGTSRHAGPGAALDDAGHGTHVSGIVASRGFQTAPGVAPRASIVAVKVLDNCSFSGCFSAFSEIVAALDYLIQNHQTLGVQVVNMSLGTNALYEGSCDQSTAANMAGSSAINTLQALGVIAFASSMNNGSATRMASPACLANVVAVGAVNRDDAVAAFSNSSPSLELLAPGVQVSSLAVGGGVRSASGTSMASPHAAGCAALLIHAGVATSPAAIRSYLARTGVSLQDPRTGLVHPRIDCGPNLQPPPSPRTAVPVPRPGG